MKNYKRINIIFKNKSYEVEINSYDSIHHVIYDLYNNIIKKDINIFQNLYYNYLIENKDYFIKIINNDIIQEDTVNKDNTINEDKTIVNTYLNPNNIFGLYNTNIVGELVIKFDIIILLNIITEYITFIIKSIILTNIIIQYILLKICKYYLNIDVNNVSFNYFNDYTLKSLFLSLIIFTIMWLILLYIIFIKNS